MTSWLIIASSVKVRNEVVAMAIQRLSTGNLSTTVACVIDIFIFDIVIVSNDIVPPFLIPLLIIHLSAKMNKCSNHMKTLSFPIIYSFYMVLVGKPSPIILRMNRLEGYSAKWTAYNLHLRSFGSYVYYAYSAVSSKIGNSKAISYISMIKFCTNVWSCKRDFRF